MKHLYFFLIVSFCSSLLSCTNDDSFLAHDFETQQNRALSIYTGNYNIYQIAKKVSLPSASTTKLNSVITNCCNDYPVIKWLHNYAKDKKYNFSEKNLVYNINQIKFALDSRADRRDRSFFKAKWFIL